MANGNGEGALGSSREACPSSQKFLSFHFLVKDNGCYWLLSSLDISSSPGLARVRVSIDALSFSFLFVAVPILTSPSGLTRGQRLSSLI
jgi:hypothetical protein